MTFKNEDPERPRSKSLAEFLESLRNQINESQKQHQQMISHILKEVDVIEQNIGADIIKTEIK